MSTGPTDVVSFGAIRQSVEIVDVLNTKRVPMATCSAPTTKPRG